MNCKNCGAPMMLVRDRDYFFCEYCGTFYFPQETEDGIRVLDPLPFPLDCPICKEALYRASIKTYPAMHCKKCRGTLMQQFIFGEVVQYLRSRARGPADVPRKLDQRELSRFVHCPHCHQAMETHPYAGPGNIFIDTCAHCSLIWLDYGEINQIVNAPGRDRGQPWLLDEIEEN
jgi:Zn-finger nucleic acid-binding protein